MGHQSERVFLAIAESKSISDAAKTLHFTQPTVSTYLSQLEKTLGVKLVYRKKGLRTVSLTPEGVEYLPLARKLVEADDEVDSFMARHRKGTLRVAASSGLGHKYIVPFVIPRLKERHPELEVDFVSAEERDIPFLLEEKGFDVAFIYSPPIDNLLYASKEFFREGRCVLCPAKTTLPDRTIFAEELDPAYEVWFNKYSTSKTSIRKWHEENFPVVEKPYFKTSALSATPFYMTDPRCWTLVPLNMAFDLVTQSPDAFSMRYVEPAPPPLTCSLMFYSDYGNKAVMRDFFACCDEYLTERPYLQRGDEL